MSNEIVNNISINVFQDGAYTSYTTLFDEIQDDLGVVISLFFMTLKNKPEIFDQLRDPSMAFNGFTNKVEPKKEVVDLVTKENKGHVLITFKDCLNLFMAHEERLKCIEDAYILAPRLYGNGKLLKYAIMKLHNMC